MKSGPTCVDGALPHPSTSNAVVEFRHIFAKQYAMQPQLTHVSLLGDDFLAAVAHLPDTTPITECTHSVKELVHNCQQDKDRLRRTFDAELLERDRVYMRALADITQILNQHSLSIHEIDIKLQARDT